MSKIFAALAVAFVALVIAGIVLGSLGLGIAAIVVFFVTVIGWAIWMDARTV